MTQGGAVDGDAVLKLLLPAPRKNTGQPPIAQTGKRLVEKIPLNWKRALFLAFPAT